LAHAAGRPQGCSGAGNCEANGGEPLASGLNLIFEWMNQVGAYLMLKRPSLIHHAENRPRSLFSG
jgi:hypothetical protein